MPGGAALSEGSAGLPSEHGRALDAGLDGGASPTDASVPADGGNGRPVDAGAAADVSPPPECVPQPDASWIPGDADILVVGPTPDDAGCGRDPYLPDHFEPPCEQPRPRPNCKKGWCAIEAGCFIMGAPWCEWGRARWSEDPVQVTLTHAFRIQQKELTQADWTAEGLPDPSGLMDGGLGDGVGDHCPVGNMSFAEAAAFANLQSRKEGLPDCFEFDDCEGELGSRLLCNVVRSTYSSMYDCPGYRLPSGAEWEYAARAGTKTSVYSGEIIERAVSYACADDPVLLPIAWYCANAGSTTHVGCQRLPNDWGLYDMIGNSMEWVASIDNAGYGEGPYVDWGAEFAPSDLRTPGAVGIQARGGGWHLWPNVMRAANTLGGGRDGGGPGLGFRLAQTLFPDSELAQ